MIKMKKKLKCLKCEYEWKSRIDPVTSCPRCKSYLWNKPKVRTNTTNVWIGKENGKENTRVSKKMILFQYT